MEVRVGDYNYDITFTVKQSDGVTAEDLTNVTSIKFQIADVNNYRNIIDGACVVTDAVNGGCKYTVQQNDFENAGNYYGTLKLTYNSGKVITTKDIFIIVKKALK